jgi:UDP-N-acetylglucosamine 2-epimerase (non-hydrolysing)
MKQRKVTMSFLQVHLICGTDTEAARLAPVALAMRAAGLLQPVLVTSDPAGLGLAAFELTADLTVEAGSLTEMIERFDDLWSGRTPDAIVVPGSTVTSLAAALAAAWRHIPIVHLGAGRRIDELDRTSPDEADGRLITQVAAMHLAPTSIAAMDLLDEGIAARDILITGDTAYDAALAIARRNLPVSQIAQANPYGDGRAADRAAQATAALLGLAGQPAPMPIADVDTPTTTVPFGA